MNRHVLGIAAGFVFLAHAVFSQSITFSELNYNSDSTINSSNWVELYNYGTSTIDLSNWYLKDNNNLNQFTIPAGTMLAPEGRLVITNSITKLTSQFPLLTNYIGEMAFSFGNDSDQVRLFDNTGAMVLFMSYRDSFPWPEAADGTGRTMELINPLVSPNEPANWFVGCMKGSPGKPFTPCNDPLVFSEINYHSDSLLDAGDWIELFNRSSGGINLTGWSFKDSNDGNLFNFPINTQIASGARLVIVHDVSKFVARHPTVTNFVGAFDFNLSNSGELVRLYNNAGKLTFSIIYDDGGNWPSAADGEGYTLELLDPTGNMNSYADWFTGCLEGSPGFAYNPDCNVGITPVNGTSFHVTASLSDHLLHVVMNGAGLQENYLLTVFNLLGERMYATIFSTQETTIDTRQYPPGIYVLNIRSGSKQWSQKFFIH